MKYTVRVSKMLAAAIVIAFAGAVEASAQTADVAGAWIFTVTSEATGVTNPAVTLEQDGETLTGHYSSDNVGEVDLSGSVSGSEITFTFDADLGGMAIDVTYTGTIDEDGVITGIMDIGGGLATGTFTAKRAEA